MLRTPVPSRTLASVGYDPATRTLEVAFLTGSVYQYYAVPPAEHEALMRAPSKGRHLNQAIKGHYHFRRVN